MKTLDFDDDGKPAIVGADAFQIRKAGVTPLPTPKMQSWLNEQGTRIIRKADGFHIGVMPIFDGGDAA